MNEEEVDREEGERVEEKRMIENYFDVVASSTGSGPNIRT